MHAKMAKINRYFLIFGLNNIFCLAGVKIESADKEDFNAFKGQSPGNFILFTFLQSRWMSPFSMTEVLLS